MAAWLFRIGRRCRKRGRDTLTDTPFLASRQFGPGGIPLCPRLLNRSLLRLSGLEPVDFLSQPGHLRRELLDTPLDGDELLVLLPVPAVLVDDPPSLEGEVRQDDPVEDQFGQSAG